jgi:uncharacterized damage-inducible protein DinB
MPRHVLDELERLLRDAFEGGGEHALLANLERVTDEEWDALPPEGARSVARILEHVGWAKWMYDDYAFRDGTLRGDQPPVWPADGEPRGRVELLPWLREGHARLLASVAALADDAELDSERPTNWGERWPTRRLLHTLIAHDAYHAGEINHIRALLQRNDRFPYDP